MKKILIVDDEPIFLQLIEGLLGSLNCTFIKTTEGNKVSELIKTENPDLLITDIFMPDKEGIEILMDTKKSHPDLPVIAISVNETYLIYASDFGAKECISKPIDKDVLLSAVRKYI